MFHGWGHNSKNCYTTIKLFNLRKVSLGSKLPRKRFKVFVVTFKNEFLKIQFTACYQNLVDFASSYFKEVCLRNKCNTSSAPNKGGLRFLGFIYAEKDFNSANFLKLRRYQFWVGAGNIVGMRSS